MFVDWNLACGEPGLRLAFWLPSLALEHGPSPDEVARDRPDVDVLAPLVAGLFAAWPACRRRRARRRSSFQLASVEVALPWAIRPLEYA